MTYSVHGLPTTTERALTALGPMVDAVLDLAREAHTCVAPNVVHHRPTSKGLPYACISLRRLSDGRTVVRERSLQHGVAPDGAFDSAHQRLAAAEARASWEARMPDLMDRMEGQTRRLLEAMAAFHSATGRGPDNGAEAIRQITISVGANCLLAAVHHAGPDDGAVVATWDNLSPDLWCNIAKERHTILALAAASASADTLAQQRWHISADEPPHDPHVPRGARHQATVQAGSETTAALMFALLKGNGLLPHKAASFSLALEVSHNLNLLHTLAGIARVAPAQNRASP